MALGRLFAQRESREQWTAAGGLPTHYSFFPLSGLEPALHAHISKVPREDGLALL